MRLQTRLLGIAAERNASPERSGPGTALEDVAGFAPLFLFLGVWLRFFVRRPFRTLGLERHGAGAKVLRGALFGFVVPAAWVAVAALLGGIEREAIRPGVIRWSALGRVLIVAIGLLVQGSADEALFRGWMVPKIGARHRIWLSILRSAIAFGLPHPLDGDRGPLFVLNVGLFAVFLAVYVLLEEGLWGVMARHAAYNRTQFSLFGLDPTAEETTGGALIDLGYPGANAFVGSGTVAEDGLLSTAVFAVALLALPLVARRRRPRVTTDRRAEPVAAA